MKPSARTISPQHRDLMADEWLPIAAALRQGNLPEYSDEHNPCKRKTKPIVNKAKASSGQQAAIMRDING